MTLETEQSGVEVDLLSILRRHAKHFDLREHPNLSLWLQQIYSSLKVEIKPWSYVHFNFLLGLGQSNLIGQVIRGTRKLSYQSAKTLARALELNESQSKALFIAVKLGLTKDLQKRQMLMIDLEKAQTTHNRKLKDNERFQFLENWQNSVVFETIGLFPEGAKIMEISGKLVHPLTRSTLQHVLELLLKLNLVTLDNTTGKYFKNSNDVDLGDSIPGLGVIRYHARMLDLAKDAIHEIPENRRLISCITITASDEEFAHMSQLVQNFQNYLMFLSNQSKSPKSDAKVFQMNMQLFPLSKD